MHNVFVLCKANLAMSRNLGLFLTSILPSKIRYNHANMIMKEITVFMKTTDRFYIDSDYSYFYQNHETYIVENKRMHVGIPPHVNQNTVFYHRL